MGLIRWQGTILRRDGTLANSLTCCCLGCPVSPCIFVYQVSMWEADYLGAQPFPTPGTGDIDPDYGYYLGARSLDCVAASGRYLIDFYFVSCIESENPGTLRDDAVDWIEANINPRADGPIFQERICYTDITDSDLDSTIFAEGEGSFPCQNYSVLNRFSLAECCGDAPYTQPTTQI